MNYLNKYLQFITGENKKKLYKQLHDFIDDLRTDNLNHLESLLTENCVADLSMIKKGITGKQNIVDALSFPVKDVNLRKINLHNVVSRSHNGIAQQSAQVQCIFGYEDEENVYPFVFGGHFILSYRYEDNKWKISHIKFDLVYEAGNNAIVAGHWKLIDYSIYSGHQPMINLIYDSPWRVIPHDDEPQSDEEQIIEMINRSSVATDCGDWMDYLYTMSEHYSMDMSARGNVNKANTSTADSKMSSNRDNLDWIRGKFHKEPRLQHVCTFIKIEFNENRTEAYLEDYRSEFNRLYNYIYTKDNIHSIIHTAIHKYILAKENGVWKIKSGAFIPHQEFELIEDECIEFDYFICGGKLCK